MYDYNLCATCIVNRTANRVAQQLNKRSERDDKIARPFKERNNAPGDDTLAYANAVI